MKPRYIISGLFLGIWFLIVIPTIIVIILPFTTGDYKILFCLFVPIFCGLMLFIFRKFFFTKFFIDDVGVELLYNGKVHNQIKWEDMKQIFISGYSIGFQRTTDEKKVLLKNNIAINVEVFSKNDIKYICSLINLNKEKFNIPMEIKKPDQKIANLLIK